MTGTIATVVGIGSLPGDADRNVALGFAALFAALLGWIVLRFLWFLLAWTFDPRRCR